MIILKRQIISNINVYYTRTHTNLLYLSLYIIIKFSEIFYMPSISYSCCTLYKPLSSKFNVTLSVIKSFKFDFFFNNKSNGISLFMYLTWFYCRFRNLFVSS